MLKVVSFGFLILVGCSHQPSQTGGSWLEQELGIQHDLGTMESTANISQRAISTTSLSANLGPKIGSFVPFLALQYLFANQTTDSSEVNNQNVSGDGYLVGAGLKYKFEPWSLSAGYSFFGGYKLARRTTQNLESVYESPGGYFTKVDISISPNVNLFLAYSKTEYLRHTLDGRENVQGNLQHTSYGLGISYEM